MGNLVAVMAAIHAHHKVCSYTAVMWPRYERSGMMPHPAAELFPNTTLLSAFLQAHSEYGKLQLFKQLGLWSFGSAYVQ